MCDPRGLAPRPPRRPPDGTRRAGTLGISGVGGAGWDPRDAQHRLDRLSCLIDTSTNATCVARTRQRVERSPRCVARTRQRVARTRGRVKRTRGRVERTHGRVERTRGRVERTRGRVERTRGRVERTHGRVERTRERVERTRGRVVRRSPDGSPRGATGGTSGATCDRLPSSPAMGASPPPSARPRARTTAPACGRCAAVATLPAPRVAARRR